MSAVNAAPGFLAQPGHELASSFDSKRTTTGPTVKLDAETFCAFLAMQGRADGTIRVYRALYLRWCDWSRAHGRDPERPDPLAVRAWATLLPGTASTRAQARAVIGHVCAALEVEDVSGAIPVPRDPRRRSRALEPARAYALEAQSHHAGLKGTAVLVGLYTAARRSEIASLAWSRVDFARERLTVWRPKTRDWHTVAMHPVLAAHLEPRRVDGDMWVFPGRHGGHVAPATIWAWVIDVAEAAGIGRVTPHELRHTCLTEANDATGDLRATQELAGHTNPAQTAMYTRVTDDRLRRAVRAVTYRQPTLEEGAG